MSRNVSPAKIKKSSIDFYNNANNSSSVQSSQKSIGIGNTPSDMTRKSGILAKNQQRK